MNMKQLVKETRTYRSFNEDRVITKEELLVLIDLARLTASGRNAQVLRFMPLYTEEDLNKMMPLTAWAAALKDRVFPPEGHYPRAFILICHDRRRGEAAPMMLGMDTGIAAQTMMLGARNMGLGGCMIANLKKEAIKKAFNLGEGVEPILALGLGEPDEIINIVDLEEDINYYRDGEDVHCVPKRSLDDLLL